MRLIWGIVQSEPYVTVRRARLADCEAQMGLECAASVLGAIRLVIELVIFGTNG